MNYNNFVPYKDTNFKLKNNCSNFLKQPAYQNHK